MSTRPAIGVPWLKKFETDLQHGYLVNDSTKHAIPRAYKKILKKTNTALLEQIEYSIYKNNLERTAQNNPDRLADAEIIHTRLKQLTEHRAL